MSTAPSFPRREFILRAPFVALAASLSGSMHSELSELVSKIPGSGMPDIYYPDYYEGQWSITRNLCSLEAEGKENDSSHSALGKQAIMNTRARIGVAQSFTFKFTRHRGHVIEDRLANAKAEAAVDFPRQFILATWDRDNPNVLSVAHSSELGANFTKEVKVTKRAFEDRPQGFGTFTASEYARVVDVDSDGAVVGFGKPPSIYARRRIVRYRVSSVSKDLQPDALERIVVDYLYPPSPPDAKPAVILKYHDSLRRQS